MNYIVTLDLGYTCHTFLCAESISVKAKKLINDYIKSFDFIGDPQLTETTQDEFELFEKSGIELISDSREKKEKEISDIRIREVKKLGRKRKTLTNAFVYRVWEKLDHCSMLELSKELNMNQSTASEKISKYLHEKTLTL